MLSQSCTAIHAYWGKTREGLSRPAVVYEIELRERLVRVEEAIKRQGDLIQKTLDIAWKIVQN